MIAAFTIASQQFTRYLRALVIVTAAFMANMSSGIADETESPVPRNYSSRWFLLHTDLPEDEAEELLEKLESMLATMSRYWGAPPRKVIECYVVNDSANWPSDSLPDDKRAAVQNGGVTHAVGVRRGRVQDMTAVVFASAKFGTPQHESVHAYCYHAFGITGPTWYAEGMAEMGTYWVEGSAAVNCPQYVVDYLKSSTRPTIEEITDNDQRTGDGWQNYAWRWALCHFLVTNPNYQDRFRQMGGNLLSGRNVAFDRTFASQRKDLEFEFTFFLDHLERGFDADLCSWDWKKNFRELKLDRPIAAKVEANRGWQPTGVRLFEGQTYRISVEGTWTVSADIEATAPAVDSDSSGSIEGCVLTDNQLSSLFPLNASESWTAPASGDLYLRCVDDWTSLSDNEGAIEVKLEFPAPGDESPVTNDK